MDLDELRRQHAEIGLTARALERAVAEEYQPEGVARLRWQLARQLLTHVALEDRIFYPTLKRSPEASTRDHATALERELGALGERFRAYMTDWSDTRIGREWQAFCVETRLILDMLMERVGREDRLFDTLSQGRGIGRSPAARSA
ncbi:hemerythrin domain-containing protein [Sphingobium abikonense]|uniref:hemerythrin domain-containing protein n=1 Tax=Sphingobium abikonense TaxID=86193 RepID=UPI000788E354|nr:hemerythrin domain-containing protein [Sphingobium abikonense]